jgi:hypothetical protein
MSHILPHLNIIKHPCFVSTPKHRIDPCPNEIDGSPKKSGYLDIFIWLPCHKVGGYLICGMQPLQLVAQVVGPAPSYTPLCCGVKKTAGGQGEEEAKKGQVSKPK